MSMPNPEPLRLQTFWIVDTASGLVLRRVQCVEPDLAEQLGAGQTAVTTATPANENFEGLWWDAPAAAWRLKGPKPDPAFTWQPLEHQWIDPRTIAQLKDAQWTKIQTARDALANSTFVWAGSTFDCNPVSQTRIVMSALRATSADASFSITWVLADNTTRVLTREYMIAVGVALSVFTSNIVNRARTLRDTLERATTAADVAAVVWTPP